MLRFLKFIVIAPFAVLFLIFAFANRQFVSVSFDPFAGGDIPSFAIQAPLFVVLIVSVMVGVVAGGVTMWFTQGKHRRAARASRAEADQLRADLQSAKAAAQSTPLSPSQRN
jgi:uncharacterized integral membrane protein